MAVQRTRKRTPAAARPGVSIIEVAEAAGVSVATVSRIVNGIAKRASPATVARVEKTISELGYRPISVGRALRNRQSRLVAVLAANIANPTMAAIAASTEHALRRAGLTMVLCDTHDQPDLQDEYLLEMRAQFSRAIVFLGVIDSPQLEVFVRDGPPLVFVNRMPSGGKAAFIGIDNEAAGGDVAHFFLNAGVTDLAVVHGSLTSSATAGRVKSFCATLAAAGWPLPPERVIAADIGEHLDIGAEAMRRLSASGEPPRGVFCLSDLIAFGAHRVASERGVRVPEDMILVGFDDNPLNEWVAPWLTSVRVPYDDYGDAVVATLQTMNEGEPAPSTLLPYRLVVRGGVRNP